MTLALHLIAHPGQPLSLQALAKGLSLPSVAHTGRMVEYLQDAWLMLAVPRSSASFKHRVTAPPKYSAVDTGLAGANSHNATADLAIQCCARLTPENRKREIRGLVAAAGLPGGVRGGRELLVITLDQEDALREEGLSIRVIPAWKWLD